ncbi:MAG TPA: phosphotransferase, partial [Myxococcaceae bacterium]|nr:phosphotransferase [Myxococcaceae bacterium]
RSLVHRDLQSKNVMLRAGEAYLIDFQGLREGTAFYDLGSLLFDPYVPFTRAERTALLRSYYDLGASLPWEAFDVAFHQAAVQRLMQALGAYGFLGLRQGKPHFLSYVPPGMVNLRQAAEAAGGLHRLRALLARIEAEAPRSLGLKG